MDPSRPGWSSWRPPAEPADGEPAPLETPEARRYERLTHVGRGGMGVVTIAYDHRLGRDVAIKRPASPEAAAALVREARLAAQLEHPGIVAVHDAGVDADGTPWLALRLVRGRTLGDALAATAPAERLRWVRPFLAACEAVAYAHRAGVVHRDLKPDNLLVGELGDTQVVDWGLACPLPGAGWASLLGDLPSPGPAGTRGYVSPEQAAGAPPDPRDDVFSLGAVLHTLLEGGPPNEARQGEAPPPGPPELVAICRRALSARPEDRYPTAAELALDVERWLDGRRVDAYAYTPAELLVRVVRAWRAPLGVAAVAGALLVGGVGVSYVQTVRERDRAVLAEAETRAALALADERLGATLRSEARHAWARAAIPEAETLAAEALARDPSAETRGLLAGLAAEPHPARLDSLPLADGCAPVPDPTGDGWLCVGAAALVRHGVDGSERWRADLVAVDAAFAGDRVAVTTRSGREGVLWLLDDATGAVLASEAGFPIVRQLAAAAGVVVLFEGERVFVRGERSADPTRCPGAILHVAAISADGQMLAAACSDGTLQISGVTAPEAAAVATPFTDALAAAQTLYWLPDGDLVAGTTKGEVARIGPDGALRWSTPALTGPVVRSCATADGAIVGMVADRGGPVLLDAATGRVLARLPTVDRGACAFLDDDLVTYGARAQRWKVPRVAGPVWRYGAGFTWVGFDGDDLLVTAGDGAAVRWGADGTSVVHRWQSRVAKSGAVLADGTWVAAGLGEPGLRALPRGGDPLPPVGSQPYRRLGALASGWVWAASYGTGLDLVRPRDGATARVAAITDLSVGEGWTTAEGRLAVLLTDDDGLWLLRDGDLPVGERIGEAPGTIAVAITPDGRTVVLATRTGIELRDRVTGEARTLPFDTTPTDAAVSGDGRWLAVGGLDGATRVFALPDGELRAQLRGHEERVGAVAFTADGARLASAGWDGVVRVWALGPLEASPEATGARTSAAWGITVDEALTASR